jgi:hypothetical protein
MSKQGVIGSQGRVNVACYGILWVQLFMFGCDLIKSLQVLLLS